MRLVWVQQWTVLPVIVEDQEMVDENGQRGRLPAGGQQTELSARSQLSDGKRPLFIPSAHSFSSLFNFYFSSTLSSPQLHTLT